MPHSVYFGGSRSQAHPIIAQVIAHTIAGGYSVHVGCQFGADQAVIQATPPASLTIFAVGDPYQVANHIQVARVEGARVCYLAGGTQAPIKARYLLRSIAAFQGCRLAVFFSPGSGSLAVAREALKAGLQVFAFQQEQPARVPSSAGSWVAGSFMGFACWQWQAPIQASLF